MKYSFKMSSSLMVVAVALLSLCTPLKLVLADEQADKASQQRSIERQIQDLEDKIKNVREDYKQEGVRVNQRIKSYEDEIAEIKRTKEGNDIPGRIARVTKEFNEWRLKRSIRSYDDKIADLRFKAQNEPNADKKRELQEKVDKLQVQNDAAQAKLTDLKATNGDNWDKIQKDLDESLKKIDQDYKAAE